MSFNLKLISAKPLHKNWYTTKLYLHSFYWMNNKSKARSYDFIYNPVKFFLFFLLETFFVLLVITFVYLSCDINLLI